MPGEIYLDWAASAPPEPEWLRAGTEASLAHYANPSSAHAAGVRAKRALDEARSRLLASFASGGSATLCSGATEANAIALGSVLVRSGQGLVAISAIEHPSVHEACKGLSRCGLSATTIGVGPDGRVSSDSLSSALSRRPRLVAVMAVNNETGAIQDIPAVVAAVRSIQGGEDVRVHVDATQALGKTPFDPWALGIDSAAFSAHKIGGPRGIGLLWTRKPLDVLWKGGGQEEGMRAGTENLGGAVSFALAAEAAASSMASEKARIDLLCSAAIEGIRSLGGTVIPAARVPADPRFSPWILQAALPGLPAEVLVRFLSARGVLVSAGSACSSKRRDRRVLAAMGVDEKISLSAFRVSFGRTSSAADVEAFLGLLADAKKELSS